MYYISSYAIRMPTRCVSLKYSDAFFFWDLIFPHVLHWNWTLVIQKHVAVLTLNRSQLSGTVNSRKPIQLGISVIHVALINALVVFPVLILVQVKQFVRGINPLERLDDGN